MISGANTKVSAAAWNDGLKAASCLKLLPGPGIRLTQTKNGTTVSASAESSGWIHPWKVSCEYADLAWYFKIAPGFVNGEPPVVVGTAPPKKKGDRKEPTDLNILEVERVRVGSLMTLGGEGARIPKFFEALGAANDPEAVTTSNFSTVNIQSLAEDETRRKLAKFDIFLSKARAQLVSEPVEVDGTGTSGSIFRWAPRYNTATLDRLGSTPRLLQAPSIPVQDLQQDAVLKLLGIITDEPEDRILVATVYFLAPLLKPSEEPDERWTAYVEQKLFYNLAHTTKNDVPRLSPPPTTFFTGLAAGLGDALVNQQLALFDNLDQQASRAIDTAEVGGRFWTI
jgi:hypothetical protein